MYAELEDNASTTSVRETAVLVSDADQAWRLLPALLVSNENGLSGLYPRPHSEVSKLEPLPSWPASSIESSTFHLEISRRNPAMNVSLNASPRAICRA